MKNSTKKVILMPDKLNWKGVATAAAIMWGVYLALAACFVMWGGKRTMVQPRNICDADERLPGLSTNRSWNYHRTCLGFSVRSCLRRNLCRLVQLGKQEVEVE